MIRVESVIRKGRSVIKLLCCCARYAKAAGHKSSALEAVAHKVVLIEVKSTSFFAICYHN